MVKLRKFSKETAVEHLDSRPSTHLVGLNGNKIGILVVLFVSLMGLIVSSSLIYSGVDGGRGWADRIMWSTLIWIVVYLVGVYLYYRTLYLFSNAYLLALSMFHLGLIYTLAINPKLGAAFESSGISKMYELSGWYVVLGFCAYGVGMAASILSKKDNTYNTAVYAEYELKTHQFLFKQGIGLGVAALLFLIMAIMSYGNILAYSRAELFNLTADSRGFGVFMMVLPGAVALLALSARTKKQKLFSYSLAIFIVLAIMLSGYRSAALFPLLVATIVWVKSGKKIPAVVAVGGVAFVLMAISVVGVFRAMGSYEKLGSDDLATSYEQASIGDSFMEMGASVGVLGEVLKLVPKTDPYRYGYSYWMSFKEMFPNIGFSIDASKSRSSKLGKTTFDQDAFMKMAPADWITFRLNRWKYDNGQGVGFSAIAEPYLNFGLPGVIVYFVFLGFFISRLDMKNIIYHPYIYLFSATIFWTLIRTVRNDFSNFTKPMGFIIVILIVWNIGLYFIGKHTKFGKIDAH